jgi:hypothetical protein
LKKKNPMEIPLMLQQVTSLTRMSPSQLNLPRRRVLQALRRSTAEQRPSPARRQHPTNLREGKGGSLDARTTWEPQRENPKRTWETRTVQHPDEETI